MSKVTIIVTSVLIAAIILVGGYFLFFQEKNDTNANNANTVSATNQNVNTTNANLAANANANSVSNTNIDTSDWLTYEDEEYGFSFTHPSDWDCNTSADQEPETYVADRIIACDYSPAKSEVGSIPSVYINIHTVFSESNPSEWLVNSKGSDEILGTAIPSASNYVIDGAPAVKIDYTEGSVKQPIEYSQGHTIVFIKNDKLFHIYSHDDVNNSKEDVIDSLLKNLKVD